MFKYLYHLKEVELDQFKKEQSIPKINFSLQDRIFKIASCKDEHKKGKFRQPPFRPCIYT